MNIRKILMYLVIVLLTNCKMVGACYPPINIWVAENEGKAELERSRYSKQVQVEEAQGKLDASELLNQAEIHRAKGTAEANKILGDSLKNNEAYLRYLWIDNLKNSDNLIYIPTEAGLPLLEAKRKFRR